MDITPICEKLYPVSPDFFAAFQSFDEIPVRIDLADFHRWRRWTKETLGEGRLTQIDRRRRLRKIEAEYAAHLIPTPRWVQEENGKLDQEALHTSSRLFLLDGDHAQLLFSKETCRVPQSRFMKWFEGLGL